MYVGNTSNFENGFNQCSSFSSDIASAVGFYTISIPFFRKDHPLLGRNEAQRLTYYYTYGRMLLKLAEALGRLVLAGRELSRLAGFTLRMTELSQVLKDLNSGSYERTMVSNSSSADADIAPCKGLIAFQDNIIKFESVPLVTPNGDVLVRELSFEVKSGCNVLVCGPNGCGKSSLFRILGELWPTWFGKITKPPRGKLFLHSTATLHDIGHTTRSNYLSAHIRTNETSWTH